MKKIKVIITIIVLLAFFVIAAPTRCTPEPPHRTPTWHIWTMQPTRTKMPTRIATRTGLPCGTIPCKTVTVEDSVK